MYNVAEDTIVSLIPLHAANPIYPLLSLSISNDPQTVIMRGTGNGTTHTYFLPVSFLAIYYSLYVECFTLFLSEIRRFPSFVQ